MASNVMSIHTLLTPATVTNLDYVDAVEDAAASDVIYMDPPYQGVSGNRDARYVTGLPYEDFVEALYKFNQRGLSYVISYDGQTGDKMHGKRLPPQLGLELVELKAGKSTTATLLGRDESTTESLYLSAPLVDRLDGLPAILKKPESQHKIQFTHG